MTAEESQEAVAGRRRRDRDATERDLLSAARRLLRRDGVLAGLNLREVADEAGVNRGLIYQYFGSRQELLRAALAEIDWKGADVFTEGRQLPFAERRLKVFKEALKSMEFIKLEALLALDGDEGFSLFPLLDRSREDLERDHATGDLDPEVDGVVAHLMSAATYLGYCVFRSNFSLEAGIPPDELDEQAAAVFERMMLGLSGRRDGARDQEDTPAE